MTKLQSDFIQGTSIALDLLERHLEKEAFNVYQKTWDLDKDNLLETAKILKLDKFINQLNSSGGIENYLYCKML